MLSDQKDHIRNPMNLENLMEAARLWQVQENKRKQIHAGILAQKVKLKQRSSFHDPTSTVAGKSLAHAHYLDKKYPTHSYHECNNKAHCRIHSNNNRYKQHQQRRGNNNNGNHRHQSRPYRPTPFKSRYPKSPNYPKSKFSNSKSQYQPRYYNSNSNSNNKPKTWNQNSIRERYNSRRKGGRGGKTKRGRRNFNQRYQNVPSYPRRHQRYNATAEPTPNHQTQQQQKQHQHNNNNNSNQDQNQKHLKNVTKRHHSHQHHKKQYHGNRSNYNNNSNKSNWRNNNNRRNNNRPTFKPTTNTVVATMTNSDLDSNESSVESFEFIAPTTNSAISSSIHH